MAGKHTLILMTQPLEIPIVYHVMPYVTPFCYESLIKRIFKFSTHYEFSSLSCDAFCSDNSLLYISFSFHWVYIIVYINFSLRKKKKKHIQHICYAPFLKSSIFLQVQLYSYQLSTNKQINTHKKSQPKSTLKLCCCSKLLTSFLFGCYRKIILLP